MRPLLIVKLGGSLITVKEKPFTPNIQAIEEVSRQVSELRGEYSFILVHGGGSYGHVVASEYRIVEGFFHPDQLIGLTKVKLRMNELTHLVLTSLASYNVPAVPVNPVSCLTCSSGRIEQFFTEPLRMMLKLGIIPLLPGDVAMDYSDKRFTIVSGDQIAARLAVELNASKLIYGTDVDGVFTGDPKRDASANLIPRLTRSMARKLRTPSMTNDVTGGIFRKVEEGFNAAEKGIMVIICNLMKPGALISIVKGEAGMVYTMLEPE
ncbi:MAG: isopentenyl phosphate kinase [Nitrososphaerota archaeon]|nr:isopentenyl phosphate kinase [Nitrososphaerota archaeon]